MQAKAAFARLFLLLCAFSIASNAIPGLAAAASGGDFQNARLEGARFAGKDLRGANLQNADLQNADLHGADLRNANLHGANLNGANLKTAKMSGALLQNASIQNASLEDADLRKATLQNVNLSRAASQGANFGDANLQNAVLQNTDLRSANLCGAVLQGANFANALLQSATVDAAALASASFAGAKLEGAQNCAGHPLSLNVASHKFTTPAPLPTLAPYHRPKPRFAPPATPKPFATLAPPPQLAPYQVATSSGVNRTRNVAGLPTPEPVPSLAPYHRPAPRFARPQTPSPFATLAPGKSTARRPSRAATPHPLPSPPPFAYTPAPKILRPSAPPGTTTVQTTSASGVKTTTTTTVSTDGTVTTVTVVVRPNGVTTTTTTVTKPNGESKTETTTTVPAVPTTVPPPAPSSSPSPVPTAAPKGTRAYASIGALPISRVCNEFSPCNKASVYTVSATTELGKSGRMMAQVNYKRLSYQHNAIQKSVPCDPTSTPLCRTVGSNGQYQTGFCPVLGEPGCVTVINAAGVSAFTGFGQAFVPPFSAQDNIFEILLGWKILDPRVYIDVGYYHRGVNYLGYPAINGVGLGVSKLPDFKRKLSFYGSAAYYPNVTGTYHYPTSIYLGPFSGTTATYGYKIMKMSGGATLLVGSNLFIQGGYEKEYYKAFPGVPISIDLESPYIGTGIRFR